MRNTKKVCKHFIIIFIFLSITKDDQARLSYEPHVLIVHHHNAIVNMGAGWHFTQSYNKSVEHKENVRWFRVVKEPVD